MCGYPHTPHTQPLKQTVCVKTQSLGHTHTHTRHFESNFDPFDREAKSENPHTDFAGAGEGREVSKMKLEPVDLEDLYRCQSFRGRYSKIQCEVHEGHNDSHAGRGSDGRWYFW